MSEQPQKHFLANIEEQLLDTWDKEKTFEKSLENRKTGELFSFYDGPPFANGMPHYGHLVQTTIKDTITRYKTMQGYYVPRRVGWDTHGLPVEYAVEKEHGFRGKQDIVAYGIDKFNAECRESVFKYKDIWEQMFRRVGRWADYGNSYATLDESYIESVWWVFKTIYDKGLVYKDFRSSPYCPRCATPLSNFELNQGYQDNVPDPSLYVKFKIIGQDAFMLGWTTTPWSLPGNAAIAVNPEAQYVYVEVSDDNGDKEMLVLAYDCLSRLNVDTYHIVKTVAGHELAGLSYEPLFKLTNLEDYPDKENLYKIWTANFVSIEDGSGVLHVAPAFGEDDLELSKRNRIPVLLTIDENGKVKTGLGLPTDFEGLFFKTADEKIIEHLARQNMVYAAETIHHTYPFCWRCDTPLLYYATDSWLVKVTELNNNLVSNNQKIKWVPPHIKNGRFGKWLENARDWAISRNRFWGAPLPVWVTDDGEVVVIGSVEELRAQAVDKSKINDLHRPFIDEVEITTKSGKIARRIPEVFDCWFESGSMPYAQDHYPFANIDNWEKRFPATFIAEAIDQTRGWFYTLHVLASALFDTPAFQNVICSGWIVAADGQKLSKRKKNYAPMDEVFDQFGVDSLRFFMASSPIVNGEDVRFSVDFLRDVQRKVFMSFNNVFSFYKLYADVDGWRSNKPLKQPDSDNVLDQWVIARVNQTITTTTKQLDGYRLDLAAKPLYDLLDDVSNWYVRRSRRRFWKSEDDSDKQQAYATLVYTLLRIAQLLAPFSPFLADYIWRQLAQDTNLPASVHISDWPKTDSVNQQVIDDMAALRNAIALGLAQRAEAKIKVRQPLAKVTVNGESLNFLSEEGNEAAYGWMLLEELNVQTYELKGVSKNIAVKLDTTLTPILIEEGIARELVRFVQNARKQAGLHVDDRITLQLQTDQTGVKQAIAHFGDIIKHETLAVNLTDNLADGFETTVLIEGAKVSIRLSKASN